MDFLRSIGPRVHQFRVKPLLRWAKKKKAKCACIRAGGALNWEIYSARKSRRDQVYKINPDAWSRFTALCPPIGLFRA